MLPRNACFFLVCATLLAGVLREGQAAPTGAVLGIDFGTDNSVVAIARRKGVDIVANEASARLTPCIVSFDSKQRYIGEGGLSQRITNTKNTVVEPKKLLGTKCSDIEFAELKARSNVELVEASNGEPLAKVCGAIQLRSPPAAPSPVEDVRQLIRFARQNSPMSICGPSLLEWRPPDCCIGGPVTITLGLSEVPRAPSP